jgi:hypothetical protein
LRGVSISPGAPASMRCADCASAQIGCVIRRAAPRPISENTPATIRPIHSTRLWMARTGAYALPTSWRTSTVQPRPGKSP